MFETILLVEDDVNSRKGLNQFLQSLDYDVMTASNGREALDLFKKENPDLVISDIKMPEMDGIEATRVIRNWKSETGEDSDHRISSDMSRVSRIPIIAMTAHAIQGDRKRCLEAGMNDYVTKPVSPQALAEALDKWLPKNNDECGMMKKKEKIDEVGSPSSRITDHPSLIFDRAGMMVRLMDDDDLARKIAEGFLEDIPRQIAALKGYLETGDVSGAERQAHTIRGASANVGGEALMAVAFEMEMAGKSGDLNAVKASMAELEAQFDRLNHTITNELLSTAKGKYHEDTDC